MRVELLKQIPLYPLIFPWTTWGKSSLLRFVLSFLSTFGETPKPFILPFGSEIWESDENGSTLAYRLESPVTMNHSIKLEPAFSSDT